MTAMTPPTTLSRRQFLQITAVAGGVYLGGRWLRRLAQQTHTLHETRLMMGTPINLTVVSDDADRSRQAIAATFAEMERLIAIFDWRQAHTPLAALNQTGRLTHPPADLVDILQQATRYSALTDGAFDVTVQPLLTAVRHGIDPAPAQRLVDYRRLHIAPQQITLAPGMAVTLDGIAKGRVIDGATAVLQAHGFANVLVEAGGDLATRGTRSDGRPWHVGVTHPRRTDSPLDVLALGAQAAATSGDYQHAFSHDFSAHHIIDPRRGVSPAELAGVTVLAPAAMDADALSTAVMVLGADAGLALIERLPHVAALLVTKEMTIIRSAHFPAA